MVARDKIRHQNNKRRVLGRVMQILSYLWAWSHDESMRMKGEDEGIEELGASRFFVVRRLPSHAKDEVLGVEARCLPCKICAR